MEAALLFKSCLACSDVDYPALEKSLRARVLRWLGPKALLLTPRAWQACFKSDMPHKSMRTLLTWTVCPFSFPPPNPLRLPQSRLCYDFTQRCSMHAYVSHERKVDWLASLTTMWTLASFHALERTRTMDQYCDLVIALY